MQSIPTVYAFVDGRPVDGFMGAVPESQVKAFIDKLIGLRPVSEVDELLAMAAGVAGAGRHRRRGPGLRPGAAARAGQSRRPSAAWRAATWPAATSSGPARSPPWPRPTPRTPTWKACAPPWRWPPTRRPRPARPSGAWRPIRTTIEARLELAKALAGQGKLAEAADQLLTIIERDRDWNDEAARKQLLTVFEAAGQASDVARQGRRRLSSILFS